MKVLAILLLLLSQSSVTVSPKQFAVEGAWLETDSKWIHAPKGVAPHGRWSQTAVLHFAKDHKFTLIYCTVIKGPKKSMNISNGDPRGVYRGAWTIHDDLISLTYQLVEQTVILQGQKLPGPVQHANIKISGEPTLNFEGKRFRRESALDETASR